MLCVDKKILLNLKFVKNAHGIHGILFREVYSLLSREKLVMETENIYARRNKEFF